MKREPLLALLAWVCSACVFGQNSFQISLKMPTNGFYLNDIAVNEEGKAVAVGYEPPCDKCYGFHLLPIDPGPISQSIHLNNSTSNFYPKRLKTFYQGHRLVVGYLGKSSHYGPMFSYNLSDKSYWSKNFIRNLVTLGGNLSLAMLSRNFTLGKDKNILAVALRYDSELPNYLWIKPNQTFHLFNIDTLGNLLWTKNLRYDLPGLDTNAISSVELEAEPDDGTYFMAAKVFTQLDKQLFKQLVVKLDTAGNPVLWRATESSDVEKLAVRKDGIYLLGRTRQPLPFSKNRENAMLCKLDFDLKPVWVRCFSGENFEYARSTLNFLQDGSMILGYSTFGAFPAVLARLDTAGRITGQVGYPLFEPQLDVLPDGSLLMASNEAIGSDGTIVPKITVAKTDASGQIDGCETFPACLVDGPGEIVFEDFSLEAYYDSTYLWNNALSADSLAFSFEAFCDIPPAPAPDFQIPPTACPGDSLRTSGAQNRLATAREWSIVSKNGLETTVRDSFELGFRFREPGVYKVSQKIWFLGCEYEAQKTVTVAAPIGAKIFADSTVCHPPIVLKVATDRPVSQYFWGNGSNSSAVFAETGQKYAVTVTDGLCSASDSFLLESFRPSPDHCFAKIYFPNVFSPDGDGKNDEFFPQGSDFEAIKLTVFDRWGNIWHDGPGAWLPGEQAQPGVFTYVFEYRDLFSNEKKAVSGSVTVAR